MKKNSWIVVANAEKAKIYHIAKVGELHEVFVMEHPEKGMKTIDLVSDRPGRTFNSTGVARHAYQPQTSEKDKKNNLFAKDLADFLNIALSKSQFSNLYLVAEPHFLGVLKKHLSNQILKITDKCLAKDLVNQHPDIIWEHCEITT